MYTYAQTHAHFLSISLCTRAHTHGPVAEELELTQVAVGQRGQRLSRARARVGAYVCARVPGVTGGSAPAALRFIGTAGRRGARPREPRGTEAGRAQVDTGGVVIQTSWARTAGVQVDTGGGGGTRPRRGRGGSGGARG